MEAPLGDAARYTLCFPKGQAAPSCHYCSTTTALASDVLGQHRRIYVMCPECGMRGPGEGTVANALSAWQSITPH